ncbi:FAD/NAD(P)-binding domain-containing protein [Rhizodiscina lignyota]|uniref:FAD/NAD(P)-binding domain-containing protein n=1 Tax=Rhizodiscina lignyota TaxID=1504668 RepID=A0A9P4IMG4_9PEZI|nr:FAD/NAD(P)-binding domain-containing protein [Rhizodiscina lignyota]
MSPHLLDTLTDSASNPNIQNGFPSNIGSGVNSETVHISKVQPVAPVHSEAKFELEDHPIDEPRSLNVAVIGAGIAGITAGVLLPVKVPGLRLTIFEKNPDVSGTWLENSYPGVRCDIPAHVYQSTFSPNTQWTEEYAQGHEIRDYWQGVARKYDVYKYLRLNSHVTLAEWDPESAQWLLSVKDLKKDSTDTTSVERFDVVITAIGRFNAWKLPDIPGIETYEGHLRHSSNWDKSFDPNGKRVAVIGNGASGIQVVPSLQPIVKHLDHYARSPTWIAGSFAGEGEGRTLEPKLYPVEKLQSFEDPEAYYKFRKEFEAKFYRRFETIFKNTEGNEKLRTDFKTAMTERLKEKPELLEQILPDFSPNCRRLTPGPGYLEALTKDNVSFIRTPIARFTKEGIVTNDDTERKVDAVICSTGANRDMLPPFPIRVPGVGSIQDAWSPSPYTYLGVATPSFPNLLSVQGPNATGHSGTVPNQLETQVTYIAQLLRKVTQQGIKTFSPSKAATDDFVAYCDAFFARTVWSEYCSSWANGGKPGGRVQGHWPGSASHLNIVRRSPRWEDWEWTYRTPSGNRFAYFGNGWTAKELQEDSDLTPYLKKPDEIDLRIYHEEWFTV